MAKSTPTLVLPLQVKKPVEVDFDGGELTSDSGLLLLALADDKIGLTRSMAECVEDGRQRGKVAHAGTEMLRSRVLAIAAGYPDCNDLDSLRGDPALKMSCGQCAKSGANLASQPTLSRYENRLTRDGLIAMSVALAETVISQLPAGTKSVIVDLDATDDPCHGQQEFEGFNRYYDNHCYLPMLVQVTDQEGTQWPIGALLRPGRCSPLAGVPTLLRRLVRMLRARFPGIDIVVRGDSAFGCKDMLKCLLALKVRFVLGIPANAVLTRMAASAVEKCVRMSKQEGEGCRVYGSFMYQAASWKRAVRVVVKVENVRGEPNARYVVTNLWHTASEPIYKLYCGRGDYENRIKELKLDLYSGRTSCHRFLANQGRLLMHLAAQVLWTIARRAAAGTSWATMQVGTLHLQLIKVAARVTESTRRIRVSLCGSYPHAQSWHNLYQKLGSPAPAS
jgi:DDE family transposase